MAYRGGVGAGGGWRKSYIAERNRRLGVDLPRWQQLTHRVRNFENYRLRLLLHCGVD